MRNTARAAFLALLFACNSEPKRNDIVTEVLPAADAGANADASVEPESTDAGAAGPVHMAVARGAACSCDADCEGTETNAGVCVQGICMTRASAECSAAGSQAECAAGSRCWGLQGENVSICWPDCSAVTCAGSCDSDGSCVFNAQSMCDASCSAICGAPEPAACSAAAPTGACANANEVCVNGTCEVACSATAPNGHCGPNSMCMNGQCQMIATGCPDWRCTGASCKDMILMPGSTDPHSTMAHTAGYYLDSPIRYSWLRRDLTMLIAYAACEVASKYPNTDPIGLSDLSQMDGLTPGVDNNSPRHPTSTHRGNDIDVAYYQTDGLNDPQIICGDGTDNNNNGVAAVYNDGYFCTTQQNIIDWPRQAYWFAKLAETPLVRVFGVDETLVDDFEMHIMNLEAAREITPAVAMRALSLGYGNAGGWAFHHHHSHMSYRVPQ